MECGEGCVQNVTLKAENLLGDKKAGKKCKNSGEIMATAMRNKDDHLKENLDGQHRKGLDVCLIVLKEVAFMLCFQSWQLCSEKQLL